MINFPDENAIRADGIKIKNDAGRISTTMSSYLKQDQCGSKGMDLKGGEEEIQFWKDCIIYNGKKYHAFLSLIKIAEA